MAKNSNKPRKEICSKHDSIVALVEEEFKARGFTNIHKYVEYDRGELDIYARLGPYIVLGEVKCTENRKSYAKAVDQLKRAERLYFNPSDRVFKLFISQKDGIPYYKLIMPGGKHDTNKQRSTTSSTIRSNIRRSSSDSRNRDNQLDYSILGPYCGSSPQRWSSRDRKTT